MSDHFTSHPKTRQTQAIERASYALGRLRATLDASELRDGFVFRQKLLEVVATTRLEARATDQFRVLGTVAGLPIRRLRDFGGLSMALECFALLGRGARPIHHQGDISQALRRLRTRWRQMPNRDLYALAHMLTDIDDNDAIGPAGRTLACNVLSGRNWLNGPIISVSEGLKGTPAYRGLAGHDERILHFLMRVELAAKKALTSLEDFNRQHKAWHDAIQSPDIAGAKTRRRTSKMPELVNYLLTVNVTTASIAARHLGITPQATARMFRELEEKCLIVAIAHRSNWRAFVTKDFSIGNADLIAPQKRSRSRHKVSDVMRIVIEDERPTPLDLRVSQVSRDESDDEKLNEEIKNLDNLLAEIDSLIVRTTRNSR